MQVRQAIQVLKSVSPRQLAFDPLAAGEYAQQMHRGFPDASTTRPDSRPHLIRAVSQVELPTTSVDS